jgi:hypothetical protein
MERREAPSVSKAFFTPIVHARVLLTIILSSHASVNDSIAIGRE